MLATRKDERLSFRELFLYGFNYTVGITFIFGFSTLFNSKGLPEGTGLPESGSNLGLHII